MLIYTFRTCPFVNSLHNHFDDVFVFGRLKDDMKRFRDILANSATDFVVGFAASTKPYSVVEKAAINQFNRTKKVDPNGPGQFELYVPSLRLPSITLTKDTTDSFCNWVMYNVSASPAAGFAPLRRE